MSRIRRSPYRIVLAVLVAAVAVLASVAGGSAAGSSPRPRPTLTLTRRTPATVVGHHFRSDAKTHVTLTSGTAQQTRVVKTGGVGGFTAKFSMSIDMCSGWHVSASQKGRATVFVRGPEPQCAPMSATNTP